MGIKRKGRYKEIVPGTRNGRLCFIQERSEQLRPGVYTVECRCDCGKTVVVRKDAFVLGRSKSCGCAQRDAVVATNRGKRLAPGESNMSTVFLGYRRGAKARGIVFELSLGQFRSIAEKPCFYCGLPPSNIRSQAGRFGDYVYSGVDRFDNTKGYTIGNCVPCCWPCNRSKRTMSGLEFIEHARKIVSLHPTVVKT